MFHEFVRILEVVVERSWECIVISEPRFVGTGGLAAGVVVCVAVPVYWETA